MPGLPKIPSHPKGELNRGVSPMNPSHLKFSGTEIHPKISAPGTIRFNPENFQKRTFKKPLPAHPPASLKLVKPQTNPQNRDWIGSTLKTPIKKNMEPILDEPPLKTILDVNLYLLKGLFIGSTIFFTWTGQKIISLMKPSTVEVEENLMPEDPWGWPAPNPPPQLKLTEDPLRYQEFWDTISEGKFSAFKKFISKVWNYLSQFFEFLGRFLRR